MNWNDCVACLHYVVWLLGVLHHLSPEGSWSSEAESSRCGTQTARNNLLLEIMMAGTGNTDIHTGNTAVTTTINDNSL